LAANRRREHEPGDKRQLEFDGFELEMGFVRRAVSDGLLYGESDGCGDPGPARVRREVSLIGRPDGLNKEIARLKAEREKASAFKDDQLDERQRFERDYLIAQIDKDIFWRETADQPHINPYYYADAIDPDVYVSREYAPLETRIKAYTTYAKNVPAALEQVKANLKPPLAMNLIKIGRQTIGGLADFYERMLLRSSSR
jgi:hypothetical protein